MLLTKNIEIVVSSSVQIFIFTRIFKRITLHKIHLLFLMKSNKINQQTVLYHLFR